MQRSRSAMMAEDNVSLTSGASVALYGYRGSRVVGYKQNNGSVLPCVVRTTLRGPDYLAWSGLVFHNFISTLINHQI